MKKRDFETYHKRFRDFEILTKFSETHVFRRTIRYPYYFKPCISSYKSRVTLKITLVNPSRSRFITKKYGLSFYRF